MYGIHNLEHWTVYLHFFNAMKFWKQRGFYAGRFSFTDLKDLKDFAMFKLFGFSLLGCTYFDRKKSNFRAIFFLFFFFFYFRVLLSIEDNES